MQPPPPMNPLAQRIFAVLQQHAVFPLPILKAQCKHLKKTPETIGREDLPRLAEAIGRAVALFSNPEKGRAVTAALRDL